MSRECMITGKKRLVGNNRSHAMNATKRTFDVNIQDTNVYSEILGQNIRIKASAHGLRTIDHKGGIDAFIKGKAKSKLHPALQKVKTAIEKKEAKEAA